MVYPTPEDLRSSEFFDEAVAYVRALPAKPKEGEAEPPTTEQRLAFYALYKQATAGPMPASQRRPGMFDPEGQFKHDAWAVLGAMPSDHAKTCYADLMALVISTGAERERQSQVEGWYAKCELPFCKRVLTTPTAQLPRVWLLGRDFAAAAAAAGELSAGKPMEDQRQLAALWLQAMYGDVNIAKPGLVGSLLTSVSGAEWVAWAALKGLPRDEAICRYVEAVKQMSTNPN